MYSFPPSSHSRRQRYRFVEVYPNTNAHLPASLSLCTCACMCVCQSDEDDDTYDTLLELDEILNLDTDADRTAYIQVYIYSLSSDAGQWTTAVRHCKTRIIGSRIDMQLPPWQWSYTASANGEEKVWPRPLTFDVRVSARRGPAMGYRSTKFGVDSSSRFFFF